MKQNTGQSCRGTIATLEGELFTISPTPDSVIIHSNVPCIQLL